jgi:adenosylhomocysteine nucleosidase
MGIHSIAAVAAMPQEIGPLLRRMKGYRKERAAGCNLYRFEVEGVPVALMESGMGPRHAAAATAALIDLAAPSCLLNFGFAGGVLPGDGAGELVLAERVLFLEDGRLSEVPQPEPGLCCLVAEALAAAPFTLHRGTFVTAGSITSKTALARLLGAGEHHPVLEMETAALLRVAAGAGIPVVALRGVSDGADEDLGFSLEEFCDSELRISVARVLRTIAAKPWIIPQLVRLSGNSRRAGKNLALGVELALKALAQRQGAPLQSKLSEKRADISPFR